MTSGFETSLHWTCGVLREESMRLEAVVAHLGLVGNELNLPGSHNNFSGSFPKALWELSQLEILDLSHLPNLSVEECPQIF